MKKPLAFFGGLIAVVGFVLSIFLELFAYYNDPIGWYGALGGYNTGIDINEYYGETMFLVAGIIVALGGVMCLTQGKGLAAIGGILVIGGCAFWYFALTNSLPGVGTFDFSIFWESNNARIGYGWITSAAGGLIGLIGAFTGKD